MSRMLRSGKFVIRLEWNSRGAFTFQINRAGKETLWVYVAVICPRVVYFRWFNRSCLNAERHRGSVLLLMAVGRRWAGGGADGSEAAPPGRPQDREWWWSNYGNWPQVRLPLQTPPSSPTSPPHLSRFRTHFYTFSERLNPNLLHAVLCWTTLGSAEPGSASCNYYQTHSYSSKHKFETQVNSKLLLWN